MSEGVEICAYSNISFNFLFPFIFLLKEFSLFIKLQKYLFAWIVVQNVP